MVGRVQAPRSHDRAGHGAGRSAAGALLAPAIAAGLAGCGGEPAAPAPPPTALLAAVADVAALAPLPDGGVRVGERRTGRIRDVARAGRRPGPVLARIAVSTSGQRGLLGLAVDGRGRTFAAWTDRRPGRRLLVAQVLPGPRRLVWRGPRTTTLANGGHLAVDRGGRLLIGIGDLQDRPRVADPGAPNGKLLALDPDGPPGQRPAVVSSGWNNPFAFTVTPGGAVWIADNAAGTAPERLARGDRPGAPATTLPARTAPSGLAAISARTLAVCGVRSGLLLRYRTEPDGRARRAAGPPLARDCRLGVVRLAGGRLAYSTGTEIRTVRP